MKKLFIGKSIFLSFIISFVFFTNSLASPVTEVNTEGIKSLVRLGLVKGDPDGNLRLEDKIVRSEMITLMVRSLGLQNENTSNTQKLDFKDIQPSHWAYNHISIAVKQNLISGYPDKTIAPDKNITYGEALTLVIRILGYQDTLNSGVWPDNVISKCNALGITTGFTISKDKQVTRGEVLTLIYNSLMTDYNY